MIKIKTLTLAAATALNFTGLPAAAHEGHTHGVAPVGSKIASGACPYLALEENMRRVEQIFHTIPQSTRMNLQHMLRHAGLYAGADDGIWGRGTDCALRAIVGRFSGTMRDADVIQFFEYMLDGGFVSDYPGTPNPFPHPGVLY